MTGPAPAARRPVEGPPLPAADLVIRVEQAGATLMLHTLPGGARYVASLIDAAPGTGTLGCVAGNDVVLVVCRGWEGARKVRRVLRREEETG
ncbi:hypothetical protein [Streptomyces sp. NPDC090025]|uniref:hypothetical protein n=1 Tax=Streptomyces sp. NPDC090025 TaxID=3365922 RepID=UPI003837E585